MIDPTPLFYLKTDVTSCGHAPSWNFLHTTIDELNDKIDRDWHADSNPPCNALTYNVLENNIKSLRESNKLTRTPGYPHHDRGCDLYRPTSKLAFLVWLTNEVYTHGEFKNPFGGIWTSQGFSQTNGGIHRLTALNYLHWVANITIPVDLIFTFDSDSAEKYGFDFPEGAVDYKQSELFKKHPIWWPCEPGDKTEAVPRMHTVEIKPLKPNPRADNDRGGLEVYTNQVFSIDNLTTEQTVPDEVLDWHDRIEAEWPQTLEKFNSIRFVQPYRYLPIHIRTGVWVCLMAGVPISNKFVQKTTRKPRKYLKKLISARNIG